MQELIPVSENLYYIGQNQLKEQTTVKLHAAYTWLILWQTRSRDNQLPPSEGPCFSSSFGTSTQHNVTTSPCARTEQPQCMILAKFVSVQVLSLPWKNLGSLSVRNHSLLSSLACPVIQLCFVVFFFGVFFFCVSVEAFHRDTKWKGASLLKANSE